MTTTRMLLHTKRNYTHRTIRKWITMTNMREQRTLTWGATSVVCQCVSDLWKTSAMHRCTWWYGADYYSGQQTSGLLALVFSRSEGRSAKHHYPIQSHGLNQHMQVVNSWYQIQSRKDYSQLQLRPPPPRRLLAPKWTLVAMHCSTDNTHFSSIPKLEALPLHDLDNRLTQID